MRKYRHRRLRRKEIKKRKIMIFTSMFVITFMLASGYAAFQTVISINAKGNIKQKPITINKLKEKTVTVGDGLYADIYENDRYIFKGSNPDNYIKFNNGEVWRIYSIEADETIKIVKDENLINMPFDPGYDYAVSMVSEANSIVGTRYSSNSNDYCYFSSGGESSYNGCNSWGSKYTTLDSSGSNVTYRSSNAGSTSTTYNLPESEAYLNVYLNHQYNNSIYKGLNSSKNDYEEIALSSYYIINLNDSNLVQTKLWNIGSAGYSLWNNGSPVGSNTSMINLVAYEKYYKWSGKVGLLTASEYLRANTNISDCYTLSELDANYSSCKITNYLYKSNNAYRFITPYSGNCQSLLDANGSGVVGGGTSRNPIGVRPSVYLASDIKLLGSGTSNNPYQIIL